MSLNLQGLFPRINGLAMPVWLRSFAAEATDQSTGNAHGSKGAAGALQCSVRVFSTQVELQFLD